MKKNNNKEKRKKKKICADPEMGYGPLSIRLGVQAALGWAQAGAGCWAGRKRARRWHGRAGGRLAGLGRRARQGMRGLGMLLGQQAVHSVHSACFDPVSTQYCS